MKIISVAVVQEVKQKHDARARKKTLGLPPPFSPPTCVTLLLNPLLR